MASRGVRKAGAVLVTRRFRGAFEDAGGRAEVLAALRG